MLGYPRQSKYANHMWKAMAEVYKESWWWNETVRKKINDKNKEV